MSVRNQIDRISTAVQNAHMKVIEKGGTSTAPYLVENLAAAIGTIPEASEPTLQRKTVSPTESAQTVRPDSGYDGLSSVSVGAISRDYVGSAVPRKGQTVYIPELEPQLIEPGQYLEGVQYIMGDVNLSPGNIKSGVSIFNTVGTYEGEGGSGGLPDGVYALASGTITPSDSVAYLDIHHGLGVAPNFLVWRLERDTSSAVVSSTATTGSCIAKRSKYTSEAGTVYTVQHAWHGYDSTGKFNKGESAIYANATDMTTTIARMRGSTNYYIKAGYKYRWVCGVLDGIA